MMRVEWLSSEDRKRARVRRGPHRMTGQILHWPYCANCGLVALKNDVTRKALKEQCTWIEDK